MTLLSGWNMCVTCFDDLIDTCYRNHKMLVTCNISFLGTETFLLALAKFKSIDNQLMISPGAYQPLQMCPEQYFRGLPDVSYKLMECRRLPAVLLCQRSHSCQLEIPINPLGLWFFTPLGVLPPLLC